MRRREEGAALLAVLLLVAVMALISVLALEKLRLATAVAANGAAVDQARADIYGAEALAALRIGDFMDRYPDRTSLVANWNGRRFRFVLPDGAVATARLRDGGNCFNLNSLVEGQYGTGFTVRPAAVTQFAALMQLLDVADVQANRVAAATADWIDSDDIANPGGAEDEAYLRATAPYRAANTLMIEPSELRAVAGMKPAIYGRIRQWLCALPSTELSPINVDTLAPADAILVAMLIPDRLSLAQARRILADRPAGGWLTIADFWRQPALAALTPPMEVQAQPQLRSRWFRLDLDVEVAGAQVSETVLIDAGFAPARVVARRWGEDE